MRARIELLIGVWKCREHREVQIEWIGEKNTFVFQRLHPVVFSKSISHLFVGQGRKVGELDHFHHHIQVVAEIVSNFGERSDGRPYRVRTAM